MQGLCGVKIISENSSRKKVTGEEDAVQVELNFEDLRSRERADGNPGALRVSQL